MKKLLAATLAATLVTSTLSALAAPSQPAQPGSRHFLQDAIRSGALTDAELQTLAADRDALRARVQTLRSQTPGPLSEADRQALAAQRQALHEKTRQLAQNDVRGPARTDIPAEWQFQGKGRHHGPGFEHRAQAKRLSPEDRARFREKMQAFRADGVIDASERAQLRSLRQSMHPAATQAGTVPNSQVHRDK